jgi:methylated-DNA-[protein]-cysteine S-methyltransferase
LQEVVSQLNDYFEGTRTSFDCKLNPQGISKRVWAALVDIPFGKTRTYFEQAKTLGDVKAIRAVAAMVKSPMDSSALP